jgi:hypothetical protein
MLRVNLEKVLNHIKLSEFPYLKWDTFKSVVHSHIFERPTGDEHSQAENDPEFPESTLTRQPVAALQTVLEEFFNNGREECQDLVIMRTLLSLRSHGLTVIACLLCWRQSSDSNGE